MEEPNNPQRQIAEQLQLLLEEEAGGAAINIDQVRDGVIGVSTQISYVCDLLNLFSWMRRTPAAFDWLTEYAVDRISILEIRLDQEPFLVFKRTRCSGS
jgi:hypothetical protein